MLAWAEARGRRDQLTGDPQRRWPDADCVVTDTWVSMGQQDEERRHKQLLGPYRVDEH